MDLAAAQHPHALWQRGDQLAQALQCAREQLVVAVDHDHPFAARAAGAGVARRVDAPVGLMGDDAQAEVVVVLGQNRGRVVRGAVVDDDDLEVPEGLGQAAVDAAPYDPRAVVRRDHDAEGGM